ncbi:MAG: PaaI family thioesterase [Deltaproteobacteria bacterium]|nr:PaaI family thioesterase [Deltaproteobacteria bacterium]
MSQEKSLQEKYAPKSICFGCGPANEKGLRIRSFPKDDVVVCDFKPEEHHRAFPGMLNGGIAGALLDCHSNWAAAWHYMQVNKLEKPNSTVTAEFSVRLLKPVPSDKVLHLEARVVENKGRKMKVDAELKADGETCATCKGLFVAVKPGHPAYDRW